MNDRVEVSISLENPFSQTEELKFEVPGQATYQPGPYEDSLKKGWHSSSDPEKQQALKQSVVNMQKAA